MGEILAHRQKGRGASKAKSSKVAESSRAHPRKANVTIAPFVASVSNLGEGGAVCSATASQPNSIHNFALLRSTAIKFLATRAGHKQDHDDPNDSYQNAKDPPKQIHRSYLC